MRGAFLLLPLLLAACGGLQVSEPPGPPRNLVQVWGTLLRDPLTRPGSFTPANIGTGGVVPDEEGNLYVLTSSVPYDTQHEHDDVVLLKVSPDGTYRGVVVTDPPLREWMRAQGFLADCNYTEIYEDHRLTYQGGLLYATFAPRRTPSLCFTLFAGEGSVIVAYDARTLERVGQWALIPGQGALAGVQKELGPELAPYPGGGVLGTEMVTTTEGERTPLVLRLPPGGPPEVRLGKGARQLAAVQEGEGYLGERAGVLLRFGRDLEEVRWRLNLAPGSDETPSPFTLSGALDLEGDLLVWGSATAPLLGRPLPEGAQWSPFLLRLDPRGRPRWFRYFDLRDQTRPYAYSVRYLRDRKEVVFGGFGLLFLDPATGELLRRLEVWR
ncbi:hypothetical protein, partial [Thermus sp.]|uniref:hypothetical protein n=1 Tax=Thermus sp. TaxID=275 RepID=UPI003D12AFDC